MVGDIPNQARKHRDPVINLFNEFIRLRQTRLNRDDAWYAVLEEAERGDVTEEQVKRLLVLAKGWEKREGYLHVYRDDSPNSTLVNRPDITAAVQQQQQTPSSSAIRPISPPKNGQGASANTEAGTPQPSSRGRNMLTGQLDPSKVQSFEDQIEAILAQKPEAEKPGQATAPIKLPESTNNLSPDYFGQTSLLLLYFRGYDDPIKVQLKDDQELVIGRSTPGSIMAPEIDLNTVNAGAYGVSRMHVAVTQQNNRLLITDLGSTNFTFINGQRLHPQEIRVLQHDDLVMFARLPCKIRFYHPS